MNSLSVAPGQAGNTGPVTREDCARADQADPLAGLREEFSLPEGLIYLDGNSLGPAPRRARARAEQLVAHEWGQGLIGSWNAAGWYDLPGRLGDLLAPLIGAGPGQTIVCDTTSANLFKVLACALRIAARNDSRRQVVLTEPDNFPTDLYVAAGLVEQLGAGHSVRRLPTPGPDDDPAALLDAALSKDVAVLMLSHVNYRTGAMWDLAQVTAQAHAQGVLVVWDLAHSVGAVPVDLSAADADFAVGCTYKYLNGGPGAPAFLWASPRHRDDFGSPLSGWWGHARPFAMEPDYEPAAGVSAFLSGTPPVVSLALVEAGLDLAARAPMEQVRAKSLALGELMMARVRERCAEHPVGLATPAAPAQRGSHLSFTHPQGYAVVSALIARGVVGDYREPQVMRFGLTPLYLRFVDVFDAVETLGEVLDARSWDAPQFRRRAAVT